MLTTTRSAIFWLSREFSLASRIARLSRSVAASCVSFSRRSNRVSSSSSRLRVASLISLSRIRSLRSSWEISPTVVPV